MELLRGGGVRIEWDDRIHAAVLTLPDGPVDYGEANTRRVLALLDSMVARRGHLRIVIDTRNASGLTLPCLISWTGFLRRRSASLHVIVHSMPPAIQGMVTLARKATPVSFDVVHDLDAAREVARLSAVALGGPSPS